MRRDFGAYLLLLLLLSLVGFAAWLTRHPDSEVVRTAEELPYVGFLASRFRELYRPPPPPLPEEPEETEEPEASPLAVTWSETEVARAADDLEGFVWVLKGMDLRDAPSDSAAVTLRLASTGQIPRLGREGPWFRVRYRGVEGWVRLDGYDESGDGPPLGRTPDPPGPLWPQVPGEDVLALVRSTLGGGRRELEAGPYALHTNSTDDVLLARLDRIVGQIEPAYVERYGLQPVGTPKAILVLYADETRYRLLQLRSQRIRGLGSTGHSARGLAALFAGDRDADEICATMIHEVVHLLDRRALGPALPSWIDEGLAEDLAASSIDADGRLDPTRLGGRRERISDSEIRWDGALGSLSYLRQRLERASLPSLARLMALDWQEFVNDSSMHYALSGLWVRYLLDAQGGRHAEAFRGFLAAVAAGEAPTVELLEARLGREIETFDPELRQWILLETEKAGLSSTSSVDYAKSPAQP